MHPRKKINQSNQIKSNQIKCELIFFSHDANKVAMSVVITNTHYRIHNPFALFRRFLSTNSSAIPCMSAMIQLRSQQ